MTNREIVLVGVIVVAFCVVMGFVTLTGAVRCHQLIRQAQHANQPAIAEWIKGSEACN